MQQNKKREGSMRKTLLILQLCLILSFCLQAMENDLETSFNPHFDKALERLREAITETKLIDQEELRTSIVSTLEKEKQWLLRNESGRAERGLYLSENIDEIICECMDGASKEKITKLFLLWLSN